MTKSGSGWELGKDGQPLSIPIWPRDLVDVREWCRAHCRGDYFIVLDRRVVFERREDAARASICGGRLAAARDVAPPSGEPWFRARAC